MTLKALLAAAALFAIGSAAQAATIERTFDVTASDFFLTGGSSPPTPVDPVTLDFTLIWDPSVSVTSASTAGFTINAFNLPDPPYSLAYTYDSPTATLTVASFPGVNSCGIGDTAYCVAIFDAAGANPFANQVNQTISFNSLWLSTTVAVSVSSPAVPEASTWAMMLIGFAGFGLAGFARRKSATA
jgi:hypothetical protein